MTSRDFCYWFQGYLEVAKPETISKEEVDMIQKHLNMVFVHEIDPSYGDKKVQATLNNIHNITKPKEGQIIDNGARC